MLTKNVFVCYRWGIVAGSDKKTRYVAEGARKFYGVLAKAGFGEVVSKVVSAGAAVSAAKSVKRTFTYVYIKF